MNKKVVDCIQAEKDRQAKEKQKNEELIQKIYDFFKDLPQGQYRIATTRPVEEKIRNHWYSKPYTYTNYIIKESWLSQYADHVTITINNDIMITEGIGYHGIEISRWEYSIVKTFYEHLDWFEAELKKEYCKGEVFE